jgi:hypothetical protein
VYNFLKLKTGNHSVLFGFAIANPLPTPGSSFPDLSEHCVSEIGYEANRSDVRIVSPCICSPEI